MISNAQAYAANNNHVTPAEAVTVAEAQLDRLKLVAQSLDTIHATIHGTENRQSHSHRIDRIDAKLSSITNCSNLYIKPVQNLISAIETLREDKHPLNEEQWFAIRDANNTLEGVGYYATNLSDFSKRSDDITGDMLTVFKGEGLTAIATIDTLVNQGGDASLKRIFSHSLVNGLEVYAKSFGQRHATQSLEPDTQIIDITHPPLGDHVRRLHDKFCRTGKAFRGQ